MKNCKYKQQNKITAQKKERKKEISLYWSQLQDYSFTSFNYFKN